MIELIKIEAAAKRIITEPDSFAALCEYEACASPATILEMASLMRKQEEALSQAIADAHGIPAQTGMIGVTAGELSCVINWLEGGRDPKDAAKELRLYCERAWTGVQPVQQPAVCLHRETVEQSLGDGTPIEFCPDCGTNRLISDTWPVQQPAPASTAEAKIAEIHALLSAFIADAVFIGGSIELDNIRPDDLQNKITKWLAESAAAPLAAPVDVPAASVQPDPAVVECMACDGHGARHYKDGEWRDKCPVCKGTGIAVGQPDSGRDAALMDALAAHLVDSMGVLTDVDEVRQHISAALAAHPANVAQPAVDRNAVLEEAANCVYWMRSEGPEDQDHDRALDAAADAVRALKHSHPANVTQLSELASTQRQVIELQSQLNAALLERNASGSVAQVGELSDAGITASVLEEAARAVEALKVGAPSYFEIDERLQDAANEVRALAAAKKGG